MTSEKMLKCRPVSQLNSSFWKTEICMYIFIEISVFFFILFFYKAHFCFSQYFEFVSSISFFFLILRACLVHFLYTEKKSFFHYSFAQLMMLVFISCLFFFIINRLFSHIMKVYYCFIFLQIN